MNAKKLLISITTCLLLCFCFLFAGCTKKVDMVGTYKFYKITSEEREVNIGDTIGDMTLTEDFAVYTLNEDGTLIVAMGDEISQGTWKKVSDTKADLIVDEDTTTVTCDGETIAVNMDGATLILKKQADTPKISF